MIVKSESEQSAGTARRGSVLVILAMIAFSFVYSLIILAPVLLQLADEFGVSVGTAGLAIAAYGIPGIAITTIAGPFSDRLGRKRFLVGGTLVLGIGTLAVASATDFGTLVALRAVAGAGAAFCASSITATVADYFPFRERGRAMGVIVGSNSLAAIVGVPLAGLLAEATSWRFSVGLVGVLAILVSVAAAMRLPPSAPPEESLSVRELYGLVLRHRPGLVLLVVGFLAAFPWAMWNAYVVVYFQSSFGLEQGVASAFAMTTGAGALVGSQIGGRLGDRIGHRRVLAVVIGGSCLIILALTNLPVGLVGVTILNFLFAACAGSRVVSHVSLLSEQLVEARGTLMSALSALMYAAVALGATAGGILIDGGGFKMLGVVDSVVFGASIAVLLRFRGNARGKEVVAPVDANIM